MLPSFEVGGASTMPSLVKRGGATKMLSSFEGGASTMPSSFERGALIVSQGGRVEDAIVLWERDNTMIRGEYGKGMLSLGTI